jgi:4-aminobutyrate aminotransferase-like enzyme
MRGAGEVASAVVNGMRERHVLISAVGADGNVLKIRPPLVFDDPDAELFLDVFADVVRATERQTVRS